VLLARMTGLRHKLQLHWYNLLVLQESAEALAAAEEGRREQADVVARLEAHVHDLESRKRAPLYQKKQVGCTCLLRCVASAFLVHLLMSCELLIPQEAELQAAYDKAKEAEARATDSEAKAKEAKVRILGSPNVVKCHPFSCNTIVQQICFVLIMSSSN